MKPILILITILGFSLKTNATEIDLKAIDDLISSIKEINGSQIPESEKENGKKILFKKAIESVEKAKSNYVQTYQTDKTKRAKDILAQLKSGNIPITTVDVLLDKMNEAINGDELKNCNSFSVKMSMTGTLNGFTEIHSINKKIIQTFKCADWESIQGFDGTDAWVKFKNSNFLTKINESEKDDIAQTSFDAWYNPKSHYSKIEFTTEKFEGKDCFVLICKNKKSEVSDRKFYVDKSTFLISGYICVLDTDVNHRIISSKSKISNKRIVKVVNNSYKKLEKGILYVDSFTIYEDKSKTEYKLIDLKFNPTIDEKIFQKPNLKEM